MRKLSTLEKRNERTGSLFILPWIIGFLIFFLSPIVNSLLYAFQNVSVRAGGLDRPFVGVQFFKQALLEDDAFLPKLSAAFGDLVYQVPIILVFSLFVAVILNQKFKGRGAARTLFFLPLMLSSTVLLSVIKGDGAVHSISDTTSVYMVSSVDISSVLFQIGVPEELLSFMTSVIDRIFDMTWMSGIQILLFLSGLQSIPGSLYEAASVEGATAWESFWKITVPMISPIILVNVIFTIIDSFTSYSNGLMQYILSETSQLHYSYAAAMTWIYFAAIMAVLGAILGLVSKKIFYSVE